MYILVPIHDYILYTIVIDIFTGKTVAQVSVRWVIQRPNVSSAIVGARSVKQLDDNLGAGKGWKLSEEDVCCSCLNIWTNSMNRYTH